MLSRIDLSKFDWQHFIILAAGAVGAGATYLSTVAPQTASVDKVVEAVCGTLLVVFGHTSASLLKDKQPAQQ